MLPVCPTVYTNTVVIGSGAAGLAAACLLQQRGVPVVLLTEGMMKGASRNTGSDKQTYYKLSLLGGDSVETMAADLFAGGAVDGDTALVEAALSYGCFSRLCDLGVPFPCNEYGEYVGYQTDHSERLRATSAGPLTSKFMTECWQKRLESLGVPVYDHRLAVRLITRDGRVHGVIAIDTDTDAPRFTPFACENVVYATGGPAGIYADSVYPVSQTGSTGVALAAGAPAQNLTEWQYGLASRGTAQHAFRWNLSGSYQQVLPRYVSETGEEFLRRSLSDPQIWEDTFLKGYQWPFDPRKAAGSSQIDLLCYQHTAVEGGKAYLDYTRNPGGSAFSFDALTDEVYTYLSKSGSMQQSPIERLRAMNQPAVDLFAGAGIDLSREPLEIAVCAQHCNGGLAADCWYESPLRHLFPIGECCGSHGVYRPGGSALNAGQVGAQRAAERIASQPITLPTAEDFAPLLQPHLAWAQQFTERLRVGTGNIGTLRQQNARRMSRDCGPVRPPESVREAAAYFAERYDRLFDEASVAGAGSIANAFRLYDQLLTQRAVSTAIADYIAAGGQSRGSYLIPQDDAGGFSLDLDAHAGCIQTLTLTDNGFLAAWRPVRPIPSREHWFETVWAAYRQRTSAGK